MAEQSCFTCWLDCRLGKFSVVVEPVIRDFQISLHIRLGGPARGVRLTRNLSTRGAFSRRSRCSGSWRPPGLCSPRSSRVRRRPRAPIREFRAEIPNQISVRAEI